MRALLIVVVISMSLPAAGMFQETDTTNIADQPKPAIIKAVVRLHSAGLFAYSGRIVTRNPVVDVNFTYERKHWGYTFFKAEDLRDARSDINFSLSGFYSNIHIGKKITITPFLAFRMEQTRKIVDKGSDALFIFTTSYHISHDWVIDHSGVLANIMLERKDIDWTNRLRLLYSHKHIDSGLMVWNNNTVLDNDSFVSSGINFAYSRIELSNHVMLSTGITGILMIRTSDTSQFPKTNGILFTMAATVH